MPNCGCCWNRHESRPGTKLARLAFISDGGLGVAHHSLLLPSWNGFPGQRYRVDLFRQLDLKILPSHPIGGTHDAWGPWLDSPKLATPRDLPNEGQIWVMVTESDGNEADACVSQRARHLQTVTNFLSSMRDDALDSLLTQEKAQNDAQAFVNKHWRSDRHRATDC